MLEAPPSLGFTLAISLFSLILRFGQAVPSLFPVSASPWPWQQVNHLDSCVPYFQLKISSQSVSLSCSKELRVSESSVRDKITEAEFQNNVIDNS